MTLQPVSLVAPDAELWATGRLRALIEARDEPYAQDVHIDNKKPPTNHQRTVAIRRDGGQQSGVFDYPRFGIRIWADVEQEASDLARLVQGLFLSTPGDGVCVRVRSLSGPSPVPDESQFQKYLTFEAQLRCASL